MKKLNIDNVSIYEKDEELRNLYKHRDFIEDIKIVVDYTIKYLDNDVIINNLKTHIHYKDIKNLIILSINENLPELYLILYIYKYHIYINYGFRLKIINRVFKYIHINSVKNGNLYFLIKLLRYSSEHTKSNIYRSITIYMMKKENIESLIELYSETGSSNKYRNIILNSTIELLIKDNDLEKIIRLFFIVSNAIKPLIIKNILFLYNKNGIDLNTLDILICNLKGKNRQIFLNYISEITSIIPEKNKNELKEKNILSHTRNKTELTIFKNLFERKQTKTKEQLWKKYFY